MPIYWTKPIKNEEGILTEDLEVIKEEKDFPFVPDGDGFEVDMNGVDYQDYLTNPDGYTIEYGKLITR